MSAMSFSALNDIVREAFDSRRFFVANGLALDWHDGPEEIAWEIFHGRLLDPAHTRERRRFHAWSVYRLTNGTRSALPVLSVKFDPERDELHVARAILCRVWEGYDAG